MYKQLEQRGMESPPVNVSTLRDMRQAREPIACLTAYDASFAQLVDLAGTDVVLVGDSLGMVIQGLDTTVPVTVDDMVYHSRCVARGLRRAFLMVDMPFMSYTTREQALDNAVRIMQEGGAMMVKLEIGRGQVGIVEYLANQDIPLCAHLGLKPQSVHKLGGFKVQGREEQAAQRMVEDARALEEAGADVLLARVRAELARRGDSRRGADSRDRYRRRPGRRRPDPRALRRPRYHARPHAALREELPHRTRLAARSAARVRSRRERPQLSRAGELLR